MTEANLEGVVCRLAELAAYQDGSVVSRKLLGKQTGNVTLFAFDDGQSLSEHTTPHDALVIGVEGKLEITVAGEIHLVEEGDVLIMPAGKPHALLARARSKMVLVMIRE